MKYLLDTNICIALLRGDKNVANALIDKGERHYLTLVTDNIKHFKRIEGLKLENWIVR